MKCVGVMYSALFIFSTLAGVPLTDGCIITEFLDSVTGEIQGGNFSYFNLQSTGVVSLELISHSGDCDLYVSQLKSKPSFDVGSYCSASSTCGLDKIIVPKSFKRPLAIAIYGHPSHEVSLYTLNIYQITETSDADNESDELYVSTRYADIEPCDIESNSQSYFRFIFSFIYYFFNSIWRYLQNTWNFLESLESNAQTSNPLLNFLLALF